MKLGVKGVQCEVVVKNFLMPLKFFCFSLGKTWLWSVYVKTFSALHGSQNILTRCCIHPSQPKHIWDSSMHSFIPSVESCYSCLLALFPSSPGIDCMCHFIGNTINSVWCFTVLHASMSTNEVLSTKDIHPKPSIPAPDTALQPEQPEFFFL